MLSTLPSTLDANLPQSNPHYSDQHFRGSPNVAKSVQQKLGLGTKASAIRLALGIADNLPAETLRRLAKTPHLVTFRDEPPNEEPRPTRQEPPVAQEPRPAPQEPLKTQERLDEFPEVFIDIEAKLQARAEIAAEFGELPQEIEELLLKPEPVEGAEELCAKWTPIVWDRRRARKALQRARKVEPGFGLGSIAGRVSAALLVLSSVLSTRGLKELLRYSEPSPEHVELIPDLEASRLEFIALRELDVRHQE